MAAEKIAQVLMDQSLPMKQRNKALYDLKNLGGKPAMDQIMKNFTDPSALLKHEQAYVLGQMQDAEAVRFLIGLVDGDGNQEFIVRHEAAEALGAIGSKEARDVLQKNAANDHAAIAETCQLSLKRIEWLDTKEKIPESRYDSVDPAPPSKETNVAELKKVLLSEDQPLFDRYRAMFALRNVGGSDAVAALIDGLKTGKSALFRHEVAFVLGQMEDKESIKGLCETLENTSENTFVRHECAQALGGIGTDECRAVLTKYLKDECREVRETCEIALDTNTYEN